MVPSSAQRLYFLELFSPWSGGGITGAGACQEERGLSCFLAAVPASTARASGQAHREEALCYALVAAVGGVALRLAWHNGGGSQFASQCQMGGKSSRLLLCGG